MFEACGSYLKIPLTQDQDTDSNFPQIIENLAQQLRAKGTAMLAEAFLTAGGARIVVGKFLMYLSSILSPYM